MRSGPLLLPFPLALAPLVYIRKASWGRQKEVVRRVLLHPGLGFGAPRTQPGLTQEEPALWWLQLDLI